MARPQKSEKFASIWVKPSGVVSPGEFHNLSLKASWIIWLYVASAPVAGFLSPGEPVIFPLGSSTALDIGPSTLSSGWTICLPRGMSPLWSIFLPTIGNVRPRPDISMVSSGGPVACGGRLANSSRNGGSAVMSFFVNPRTGSTNQTPAVESSGPKGLEPLKVKWARPSKKLLKLKTALMLDGVLRGVTRRMLTPPALNISSVGEGALSIADPKVRPVKSDRTTPWDPTTSLESRITGEFWKSGLSLS